MDAETHRRFRGTGIKLRDQELTEVRREISLARLPCLDLLEEIAATQLRVEQESVTAAVVHAEGASCPR